RFVYDRESLPEELPPLIDRLGPDMVKEGHAIITITEDKEREEELNQQSKPDEYIIPYLVRLPWEKIGFQLKEEPIEGRLFGFHPGLVHMPPFIETLALRGLRTLAEAAGGAGNTAEKLKEAARYRIVAEAIMGAARYPLKKAIAFLHERYPFGIGSD